MTIPVNETTEIMRMRYLHELMEDHPDRNRPLVGCWYRWRDGNTWKEVKKTFKISSASFNSLGSAWTDNDVFTFDRA